jgi:hypothetical protein
LSFNPIYIVIIVSLSIFVVAEILIAYQKYQLKKRFIEELDEYESKRKADGSKDINDEKPVR